MANEPITREEILLNAVATGEQANINPITREEMFLAKAGGQDVKTPTPITRKEMFLNKIAENGGGTPGGGGSTASVPWNDVTFIDYDGTVLHSYTLEEAQALTELPPLPEQKGLICQGWNWSLEDIKAQNGPVTVGAMYITDDGKTRIYITLREGRTSPMLGVCPKGTVTVDWGDGTEPDVLTGTSTSTVKWTPTHNYAKAGDYVINLSVDGEMEVLGIPASGSYLLRCSTSTDKRNYAYQSAITKVEIGDGVTNIGYSALDSCFSLESITIPSGVTIGTYVFRYCYSLASLVIPDGVTSIGDYMFNACYSLTVVAIPRSIASIGTYVFAQCYSLASLVIPDGITSLGMDVLSSCNSLRSITIPNSVNTIGANALSSCRSLASAVIPDNVASFGISAFSNCYSITHFVMPKSVKSIDISAFNACYSVRCYDFSACTSVPTLSATSAFTNIPSDCQMLIPSALYDEWSTATNWATYASYMVAV